MPSAPATTSKSPHRPYRREWSRAVPPSDRSAWVDIQEGQEELVDLRRRLQHLDQAAESLHQAGFPDRAQELVREREKLLQHLQNLRSAPSRSGAGSSSEISRLTDEVHALRTEVRELRELVQELRRHVSAK